MLLDGFDRTFVLNLNPIKNADFLSPNLNFLNKKNKYSLINPYAIYNKSDISNLIESNCFYNGFVDDDINSQAHINLCHDGHIVSLYIYDFLVNQSLKSIYNSCNLRLEVLL